MARNTMPTDRDPPREIAQVILQLSELFLPHAEEPRYPFAPGFVTRATGCSHDRGRGEELPRYVPSHRRHDTIPSVSPRPLNKRRLTRDEVRDLLKQARPREDLSGQLCPETSLVKLRVFELHGDQFLVVFGPSTGRSAGRGDLYSREQIRRWVRWVQRLETEGVVGSVDHWHQHSRVGARLVRELDALILALGDALELPSSSLDRTYKSLRLVSAEIERFGLEEAIEQIYDNLIAYVGETIRDHVNRKLAHPLVGWTIESADTGFPYPALARGRRVAMPINVVWGELTGPDFVDLRSEAIREARRVRR